MIGGIAFQHHFAGPAGMVPIIALGFVTYLAGISGSRTVQYLAIALNALALIFYKYTLFFAQSFIGLFSPELAEQSAQYLAQSVLPAAPPLGISFFVFEFVHYLSDLLIKGTRPITSPRNFVMFGLYWPTMVAGPIKRYEQFLPSMYEGARHVAASDVMIGLNRVALGIVKKFIADNLTLWIAYWGPNFETASMETRWLFLVVVGIRILFDFSGYSDIAIGFAKMMGVKVPENFNWPYLATGPSDFWRRWHISLSSWIRDYIYIPLGGNRVSLPRKLANFLVAFALCGLWHGAGWNFVIWGLYHGFGLMANSLWSTYWSGRGELAPGLRWPARILSWACTLLFVLIGWLFFFYPLQRALAMIGMLVGIE